MNRQPSNAAELNTEEESSNIPPRYDEEILEGLEEDEESRKQTEDEDEYFVSCEYCQKEFDNKLGVLECYTRHFKHELKTVCKSLLDSEQNHEQCPFCSEKFEHFESLTCHLGTVHLLVNDFLIREGIRPLLPSSEDYEIYLDSLES